MKIPPETIVDDDSEKLQQMKPSQDDEEIINVNKMYVNVALAYNRTFHYTLIISSHLELAPPVVLQPSSCETYSSNFLWRIIDCS